MSFGDADLSAITRVRQLLQHLAEPHAGLRLITQDAETHAAALTPGLALLDPQPFQSLATSSTTEQAGGEPTRSPSRRPRPLESRAASNPSLARVSLNDRTSSKSARVLAQTPAKLITHHSSLITQPSDALPPSGSPAEQSQEKMRNAEGKTRELKPLRESVLPAKQQADEKGARNASRRGSTTPSTSEAALNAANADAKVDVGALAERVIKKRNLPGPSSPRVSSEPSSDQKTKPVIPVSVRRRFTNVRANASVVGSPGASTPSASENKPVIPVSGMRRPLRSGRLPLEPTKAKSPGPTNSSEPPLPPARPTMVPSPPTMNVPRAAAPPTFFFDPFEERAAADDSDFRLTQRIDEALREQARRQGVDLT